VTLVILADRIGIFALALGPLIGQVAGVVLLAALIHRVLRDPPSFAPTATITGDAGRRNRRFWISLAPMSLAANFGHINLLVDNAFASYLPTGAITMLGFAFVIVSNSELLTTLSFAEVSFARFASSALQGTEALRETLRWSLRHMTLVTAPLSAGALVFGMPLVRLLFQRGQFTAESTVGVSSTLMCYSLEILFMGYVVLFMRLLFALKRIAFVAWTSSGAILANIVLDYLLMKPFGINGIALATTCVALLHLLVLIPIVRREVPAFHAPGDTLFLAKVLGSAATMSVLVLAWASLFEAYFDTSTEAARVIEVGIGLSLGAVSYVGLLHALRVDEARTLIRRFAASVPLLGAR
jgi:putative peptidoglycan lipid II flippase